MTLYARFKVTHEGILVHVSDAVPLSYIFSLILSRFGG